MRPRKKSIPVRKAHFAVLGEVKEVEGRKRFVPYSIPHMNACVARLPVGKKLRAEFVEIKYLRSDAQLRYHRVLCGYIAEHTGHTPDEVHAWAMVEALGAKVITIAGRAAPVRRSLSQDGDVTKAEAVELVDFDLMVCEELEIRVPTREELGYLPTSYAQGEH